MTRLIKRYANRKLYDSKASRYVTLEAIAELVRKGEDLRIIDNDSGEDLTAVTFAQVIYEEAKRSEGLEQAPVLRWMIQQGGTTLHELLAQLERGKEALESMREAAGEGLQGVRALVLGDDEPTATPEAADGGRAVRLLHDLLDVPQRQIEQVSRKLDAQVRASIERVTKHPGFRQELHRIEDNLRLLEQQLGQIRRLAQPRAEIAEEASEEASKVREAAPSRAKTKTKAKTTKAAKKRRGPAPR